MRELAPPWHSNVVRIELERAIEGGFFCGTFDHVAPGLRLFMAA